MNKPYHWKMTYKKQPLPAWDSSPAKAGEFFTGFVRGIKASTIEERFARALDASPKFIMSWMFRVSQIEEWALPGAVEVDFLVYTKLGTDAIFIDGEYAHKSAAQKARDKLQDARLYDELEGVLARFPIRIPGDTLETQDDANRVVEELFK